MAIFDKISNMAKSLADNTQDMIETNKLNGRINAEKKKISELKEQIGEFFWQKYQSGEFFDDEPTALCGEIKLCEENIVTIQTEIQAIKNAAKTEPAPAAGKKGNICSECGAENPENTKFCKECGRKMESKPAGAFCSCGAAIPAGSKFCPECGKPSAPAEITCSCGAKNKAGTKFCSECGNRLE